MAQENIRKSGSAKEFKNDRDGGTTIDAPVLGIVKDNVDPTKSGRIQVYISSHSGPDPDDSKSWVPVSYLSPFYGVTSPGTNNYDGQDSSGLGKFVGNPQSYGFWTGAPDIGTEVICVFIDGRIEQGYYIGCVPQSGLLQMTPAMGAATTVIPNSEESKTYGGADRLPTSEVNYSNPTIRNSSTITTDPKPVHSYQSSILSAQGLVRDNIRGVISSSAQRETPSKVFGISTPGNPIYNGGYTSSTIRSSAAGASSEKLEVIGRTGGHSFVMDDGTIDGQDQLIRLRTSSGHQIMMNDSGETLFITHANGQSWIELGKEGTIDLFATNSVNIRTQGDLNLHADRDVNINAKKKLNIFADDINVESDKNINFRAGINFAGYAAQKYTFKTGGDLSLLAGGAASLAASGIAYVNGNKVNLNTGNTGTVPAEVPSLTKINHIDTAYSTEKGWMFPSPTALVSVVSRAPTHQPFIGAGKGVDIKTSSIASPTGVQTTTPVNKINEGTPNAPVSTVTPAIASTVPTQTNTSGKIFSPADVSTLAAQQAVTNRRRLLSSRQSTTSNRTVARNGVIQGVEQGVGASLSSIFSVANQVKNISQLRYGEIIPVTSGITVTQATASGSILKPGSRPLLQARLDQGMPLERALEGLTTGNYGAKTASDVINNTGVQLSAITNSINQSTNQLVDRGILTGEESPAQAGGVVLAASNYGTKVVTGLVAGIGAGITATATAAGNIVAGTVNAAGNLVAGTVNAVAGTVNSAINAVNTTVNKISDITDTISSGKFAGNLSDAISNGITGLATSVSNVVNGVISGVTNTIRGIGNQISSITTSLAGTLRNAFDTVEKSFKDLTADKPNTLGGSTSAIAVNVDTPSSKYESAEADLANAESDYLSARKAYRNDPSEENAQALRTAEEAISSARQKASSAATSIITDPISRFTSGIKSVFTGGEDSKPVTTSNSGMNALPGGVDSAVNQTTSTGSNILTGVKNAVTTVSTAAVATITNTAKLAGNLVKNTVSAVANTVSSVANSIQNTAANIKTAASSIISKIQTQLSSIGNAGGQVKSATQSVDTYNTAPIVAKTASLLGDSRIPNPEVVSSPPELDKTNQQVDDGIRKQAEALSKVEQEKEEVRFWQRRVSEWEDIMTPGNPLYSPEANMNDVNLAKDQLKRALNKLRQAESEYSKTLRG